MSFRPILGSKSDWIRILSIFACVIALGSVVESWGKRRFIAEFAENFIAGWFIIFVPLFGFICAVATYSVLREKNLPIAIAAIGGIAVVVAAYAVIEIGKLIPGVGWRVEKYMGESY